MGASQGREAALLGIVPNTAGSRSGQGEGVGLPYGVESLPRAQGGRLHAAQVLLRPECHPDVPVCFVNPSHPLALSESPSRVVCTVKRLADNALTPDTLINENVPKQQFVAGGSVPRGAAGALAASCAYTPPYRAFNIQTLPSRCCPASLSLPEGLWHGSLWHGSACPAATAMRARWGASGRAGSARRRCATVALWIIRG